MKWHYNDINFIVKFHLRESKSMFSMIQICTVCIAILLIF